MLCYSLGKATACRIAYMVESERIVVDISLLVAFSDACLDISFTYSVVHTVHDLLEKETSLYVCRTVMDLLYCGVWSNVMSYFAVVKNG